MGERHPRGLLRRGAYLLLAGALAATVSLLAACGGGSGSKHARTVAGLQVSGVSRNRWTYARLRFREMCAGCHSLADAHARGQRYYLDQAGGLSPDRVRFVIENGEPGMPAWRGIISRREEEELVAYVSAVARHGGGETHWLWQIRLRGEGEQWRPPGSR
jgi:mono/diheme cytochrome c family protein